MNNDIKIVIDPGHGGTDSGAASNGMLEKDYTLLISKYMKERLDEMGVPSILTRSTDETLSPSERVNRVENISSNSPNVVLISNHLNAGGGEGAEIIYSLRNNDRLSNSILTTFSNSGFPVRKIYQRRLPNDPTKDYYFILRDTSPRESIIVEYGFIDNKKDAENIKNNYKKYVEDVLKSLAMYMNFTYVPPRVQEEYVVQRGDTLWNISKKLDTTVDELKRINNLNNNLLYIGQVLKVPSYETASDSNITYIVKKGDTLYSIAREYNTTVDELKRYNNLTSDILSLGQQIKIPESESIITPSEDEVINKGNTYIVKKGDTLYSIAREFGITVNELKEINSITSDLLSIGTELLIPNGNIEDIIEHTVEKNDSLWSLARKYNTTVDLIKQLNNLTSDLINIGTKLLIKQNTK